MMEAWRSWSAGETDHNGRLSRSTLSLTNRSAETALLRRCFNRLDRWVIINATSASASRADSGPPPVKTILLIIVSPSSLVKRPFRFQLVTVPKRRRAIHRPFKWSSMDVMRVAPALRSAG